MTRRCVSVAALAVLLSLGFTVARAGVDLIGFEVGGSPPPSPNLFAGIGAPAAPGPGSDPGASTEWPVTVNFALLQMLPETVVLNLPDHGPVTLARNRSQARGPGAFLWSGRGGDCSGIFSALGERFLATISCLGGSYRVRTPLSGARLTRYAFGAAPPGAEADVALVPAGPPAAPVDAPASPGAPSTPTVDDQVDVLILYTSAVRQAIENQNGNVRLAMQHIMDETQQAMDNSGSAQTGGSLATVHLVRAQEVGHPESGTLQSDLFYLQGLAGSTEPIDLRNYWAADIVMLVRESPSQNKCGLAYTPGYGGAPGPEDFEDYAVGVTVRVCDFSGYPFQHEFGHIFGANHNPENNANTTRLEYWALAHWANPPNKGDGHRTLVAYAVNDPTHGLVCRGDCDQILNYANAEVYYDDGVVFQTGLANEHENARVIAEVAPHTVLYKSSLGRIFADGFD